MTQQNATWPHQRLGQRLLLLAGLCLLSAAAAAAVPYPNVAGKGVQRHAGWVAQCMRVKAQQAPARDRLQSGDVQRCEASDLYYDARNMEEATDADWRKVRECAFRTSDSGVLMMLYANGAGVSKNLALATKYACSLNSSPAEMQARLAHLRRVAAGNAQGIDQCDDSSSGHMQGSCAGFRERRREAQRSAHLAAISAGWSEKQRIDLEIASKAVHDFAQHRSAYETDLSGNSRLALQVEATAEELDQFMRDIDNFETSKLPRFSEGEFKSLDDKMNEVYRHFMETPAGAGSYLGTIRKSAVERTQHAWLAYRDAMELLGSVRYPSVPAPAWRALLTSRRLKQLTELDNAAMGR